MNTSGRRGRQLKSYTPKAGSPVLGLARTNDGRWRVSLPDGRRVRFTEPNEARAIDHARQLLSADTPTVEIPLDLNRAKPQPTLLETAMEAAQPREVKLRLKMGKPTEALATIHADDFWAAVRRELLGDSAHAATMAGIPGLARMIHEPPPQPLLKLTEIIAAFENRNPSNAKSKHEAVKPLKRLIAMTDAATLADLTTDKLLAFRDRIESDPRLKSAGTRRAYFGRIRNVIGFGLKIGLDAAQIRSALDRCEVLWTSAPMPNVQPNPISREHFHTLLTTAGNGPWRWWLLVGLNLCLHIEEVCTLKWADLSLEHGTHAAIREKTRRKRIPRAAVLWPETIAVLKSLPRKGPYVFTSSHGTRYNKNTRVNDFREFRIKAGLPDTITFDTLRDAAYTAACQGAPDERQAKVLAGQAAGLRDNYVLRNPEFARPACDAVYKAYGPFPDPPIPSMPTKK